jgi:phytoene desaturase
MTSAIVIGGGFGGLAAALRLKAKGYDVELIDRCRRLGGRAQVFERDGYRHDAGPTVITAPFLFDELFELFGRSREDYVRFVPLEPWYRFQFPDGETFDYGGTVEDTMREIARFNPDDCAGYEGLLEQSRKIFEVGFEQLADAPFHRLPSMLAQLPNLLKLGSRRSVWELVCHHIKDPRLRQAFSIQPLLVGGNPFDTTSVYGLIHHVERRWGVQFAMGGTGAIVDALARLMDEVGVTSRLETTVDRLVVEGGAATGVVLDTGETIRADLVVSNADPAHLYRHMVPEAARQPGEKLKTRMSRFSMGLFVLFFGTDRTYPDVAHHTIWLGRRYKELLADIFDRKVLADDFSLYLHRPTATDPGFAPEGHDSFYVLAPVPNLQGDVDWEVEGPKLRDRIVKALGETILPELSDHIRSDFWMTPEDFERDYLSVHGAGFSIAPHLTQSAWFRYHNKAEGPRNLFLVGAGTHPGAGLPGVLCSAKVVDSMIPSVLDQRLAPAA